MLNVCDYIVEAIHSEEKMSQVEELVFERYKIKNFCSDRFEIKNALTKKNKITLAAYEKNLELVATVSLVFDIEKRKLPCEHVFKNELDQLRQQNRKLVEMTKLATVNGKEEVIFYFLVLIVLFTQKSNYSDMIAMIETKHISYFNSLFRFEVIGVPKMDTHANNELSSLIRLDATSLIKQLLMKKNKRAAKVLYPMMEQDYLERQHLFINEELSKLDFIKEDLNALMV